MNELKNLFNSNNAFVFLCCKKCGKALNKNNTAMYRNKYYQSKIGELFQIVVLENMDEKN